MSNLQLDSTKITDAGMPAVANLTKLKRFRIRDTDVTGEGFAHIAKLKKTNIAAAAQHSRRQRETPNADPEKSNVCLIDA